MTSVPQVQVAAWFYLVNSPPRNAARNWGKGRSRAAKRRRQLRARWNTVRIEVWR